jgi:hypothetical protein
MGAELPTIGDNVPPSGRSALTGTIAMTANAPVTLFVHSKEYCPSGLVRN